METGRTASGWSLFSPRGRSGRRQFWAIVITLWVITFLIGFIQGMARVLSGDPAMVNLLFLPVFIPFGWIWFCTLVKRLHDLGLSAWWMPAFLLGSMATGIVFAGIALNALKLGGAPYAWGQVGGSVFSVGLAIVLGSRPSAPGENRFGPPHDQRGAAAVFS